MSAFYKRKWATFFDRLDVDGDGALTVKDFEALADKLIERGRLDIERGAKLRNHLISIWDQLFKEVAGGKPLNKDALVEAAVKKGRTEEYLKVVKSVYTFWFESIDTNGDDLIEEKELIHFFAMIGLDAEMAKLSFQAIDANHDGVLSLEEYVSAAVEYFSSDDETSMNRYFWGPLSTY